MLGPLDLSPPHSISERRLATVSCFCVYTVKMVVFSQSPSALAIPVSGQVLGAKKMVPRRTYHLV